MEKIFVEVSFFSDRTIRTWKHIIEVELKKKRRFYSSRFRRRVSLIWSVHVPTVCRCALKIWHSTALTNCLDSSVLYTIGWKTNTQTFFCEKGNNNFFVASTTTSMKQEKTKCCLLFWSRVFLLEPWCCFAFSFLCFDHIYVCHSAPSIHSRREINTNGKPLLNRTVEENT